MQIFSKKNANLCKFVYKKNSLEYAKRIYAKTVQFLCKQMIFTVQCIYATFSYKRNV